jgi:two-component system LytT family response regulator
VKVSTLIVDDEPLARSGLRSMLAEIDWLTCVGEASNGPAAVAAINSLRPELVFLDIQLPGFLGTEVLQRIEHQPYVVFATAFAQHAVTAFELGALDYLLKPFGPQRLAATLERVQAALGGAAPSSLERFGEISTHRPLQRLFVRSGSSILPLPVSAISRFSAWGDYVTAHAGRARHVLHLSLNHLETCLDPSRFLRVHRSTIVNLDRVTAFRKGPSKQLIAELDDGAEVPVSRNRAKDLRDRAV